MRLPRRSPEKAQGLQVTADGAGSSQSDRDALRLRRCLDQLPAEQRRAIRIAASERLTYSRLAERLGLPLETTRTIVRSGLAALRDGLDRKDD